MPPYLLLGPFSWKHLEASKAERSGLMHFAARISKTQTVKSPNSAPALCPGEVLPQLEYSRGGGNLTVKTQNHTITECLGLEGTSVDHLVQPSC